MVFVALFVLGSYVALLGQGELPSQSSVRTYADEVITCYTDLVTVHYSLNPDFSSLKPYFRLYNDSTHSFEVLVMQAYPSNISNTVALIFEPINASKTSVLFDYSDTFEQLYLNNQLYAYRFVIEGGTLDFNGNPALFNLAFNVPPTDITSNAISNANSEAAHLFENDASKLPSNIGEVATTAQTGVCPSSPPWYQPVVNVINYIIRFWVYTILVLGVAAVTYIGFYLQIKEHRNQRPPDAKVISVSMSKTDRTITNQ